MRRRMRDDLLEGRQELKRQEIDRNEVEVGGDAKILVAVVKLLVFEVGRSQKRNDEIPSCEARAVEQEQLVRWSMLIGCLAGSEQ
jgi:hypothetical protein